MWETQGDEYKRRTWGAILTLNINHTVLPYWGPHLALVLLLSQKGGTVLLLSALWTSWRHKSLLTADCKTKHNSMTASQPLATTAHLWALAGHSLCHHDYDYAYVFPVVNPHDPLIPIYCCLPVRQLCQSSICNTTLIFQNIHLCTFSPIYFHPSPHLPLPKNAQGQ